MDDILDEQLQEISKLALDLVTIARNAQGPLQGLVALECARGIIMAKAKAAMTAERFAEFKTTANAQSKKLDGIAEYLATAMGDL